jgi:orotidine-5'-phosphate decarboxylase
MSDKIRKIIPALDVTDLKQVDRLIRAVGEHPCVYGFKIGFALGLRHGLPEAVAIIKSHSTKPVIYDHQKAGTDIPDTGKLFAAVMKECEVDEVILFPQAGPATLEAWVKSLQDQSLHVIVGGIMTHPRFVVSEGGFISDDGVLKMYSQAYGLGVRSFVVPLTKPQATQDVYHKARLDRTCAFYSPGFGSQGGDASKFDFLDRHYLIIGRSLMQAADPEKYLTEVGEQLEAITKN